MNSPVMTNDQFGVTEKSGKPVVSSRRVADIFNKQHDNVLRDVRSLMIPSRTAQMTLHDVDYTNVKQTIENARSLMTVGQGRAEIRCPICGGTAWVTRREYNRGDAPVAKCDDGCFFCYE